MQASRESLQRELADIELALSVAIGFRHRQVLMQHREEVLRQLRRRRSWWQRWFAR